MSRYNKKKSHLAKRKANPNWKPWAVTVVESVEVRIERCGRTDRFYFEHNSGYQPKPKWCPYAFLKRSQQKRRSLARQA